MRFTPVYRLPALEATSTAREVYEQSWNMATELERVLLNTGQVPIGADAAALIARVNTIEDQTKIGPWTDVAFASGWGNHPNEAAWGRTQWRTIGNTSKPAYLELRGEVACPAGYAVDATMFTLPAAVRPVRNLQVLQLDNANAAPGIAMVGIRANGQVTLAPTGKQFINLTVRVPLA